MHITCTDHGCPPPTPLSPSSCVKPLGIGANVSRDRGGGRCPGAVRTGEKQPITSSKQPINSSTQHIINPGAVRTGVRAAAAAGGGGRGLCSNTVQFGGKAVEGIGC